MRLLGTGMHPTQSCCFSYLYLASMSLVFTQRLLGTAVRDLLGDGGQQKCPVIHHCPQGPGAEDHGKTFLLVSLDAAV